MLDSRQFRLLEDIVVFGPLFLIGLILMTYILVVVVPPLWVSLKEQWAEGAVQARQDPIPLAELDWFVPEFWRHQCQNGPLCCGAKIVKTVDFHAVLSNGKVNERYLLVLTCGPLIINYCHAKFEKAPDVDRVNKGWVTSVKHGATSLFGRPSNGWALVRDNWEQMKEAYLNDPRNAEKAWEWRHYDSNSGWPRHW